MRKESEGMQNNITYYRKNNDTVYVHYQNSTQSYPVHTHANHVILGYVLDGVVRIGLDDGECLCHAGECYCIMPDIAHSLEPEHDTPYTMIIASVTANEMQRKSEREKSCSKRLKQMISDVPENAFLIEDMARSIGISPYYMIRQFKDACGLTPHQFQIQCKVRKAQKLLEEGKSVIEVAYATGFCDQSHFDRCFRKIVRLTPKEYKQSVKQFN